MTLKQTNPISEATLALNVPYGDGFGGAAISVIRGYHSEWEDQ